MSPEFDCSISSPFAKGIAFKKLHKDGLPFFVPNAWDAGSASLLTDMGFLSLCAVPGVRMANDGMKTSLKRDQVLTNAFNIVSATNLPVTVDLENGYGHSAEICMETVILASKTGLVGGCIGDFTGNDEKPIYDFSHAVERIISSVDAARSLPFHFTLTASSENYLHGIVDLDDTIKRLVAYANAGADVLFAPGITKKEEIEEIVKAVSPRPVNVLMGYTSLEQTMGELAKAGVCRISMSSSFAHADSGDIYLDALRFQKKRRF